MSENNEFTFENEQYRKTYWHTCSHVLAQAVKRLHPEVKLAIGRPSITASTMTSTRRSPSRRRCWRNWKPRCARSARKS